MTVARSREEAKLCLARLGKTAADVARDLNVSAALVRGVLSGHYKGTRGDAHKIAVTLGIKDGVIVDDETPLATALKAAFRS